MYLAVRVRAAFLRAAALLRGPGSKFDRRVKRVDEDTKLAQRSRMTQGPLAKSQNHACSMTPDALERFRVGANLELYSELFWTVHES